MCRCPSFPAKCGRRRPMSCPSASYRRPAYSPRAGFDQIGCEPRKRCTSKLRGRSGSARRAYVASSCRRARVREAAPVGCRNRLQAGTEAGAAPASARVPLPPNEKTSLTRPRFERDRPLVYRRGGDAPKRPSNRRVDGGDCFSRAMSWIVDPFNPEKHSIRRARFDGRPAGHGSSLTAS